jgi:predicted transcriptional regulator
MKITEFLTHSQQRLVACLPDDLLNAVARLMYTRNIGAMPVCELVRLVLRQPIRSRN